MCMAVVVVPKRRGRLIMGGKPSRGTPADKRLSGSKPPAPVKPSTKSSAPFGGKKASPFKQGGSK